MLKNGGIKVIFLDIDGVLNSLWSFKENKKAGRGGIHDVDRPHTAHINPFNEIMKKTDAKIVISSTWRLSHTREQLIELFKECNIHGDIIGVTPRRFSGVRGDEIQLWLDNTFLTINSFVIIDDDSNMAHLEEFFTQTTWERGLQSEHIDKTVEILMRV